MYKYVTIYSIVERYTCKHAHLCTGTSQICIKHLFACHLFVNRHVPSSSSGWFPHKRWKMPENYQKNPEIDAPCSFFFRFLKQAFSGSMLVCPGIILTDQNRSWMLVNGIGILPLLGTNCWEACRCGVSHANIDIHNMFICIGNTHKKSTHISIYLHPTVCSSPSLICTELYNYMQIKKPHTYIPTGWARSQ